MSEYDEVLTWLESCGLKRNVVSTEHLAYFISHNNAVDVATKSFESMLTEIANEFDISVSAIHKGILRMKNNLLIKNSGNDIAQIFNTLNCNYLPSAKELYMGMFMLYDMHKQKQV